MAQRPPAVPPPGFLEADVEAGAESVFGVPLTLAGPAPAGPRNPWRFPANPRSRRWEHALLRARLLNDQLF